MAWLYTINTEVPAPGDSLSWDTKLIVCDITTLGGGSRSHTVQVFAVDVQSHLSEAFQCGLCFPCPPYGCSPVTVPDSPPHTRMSALVSLIPDSQFSSLAGVWSCPLLWAEIIRVTWYVNINKTRWRRRRGGWDFCFWFAYFIALVQMAWTKNCSEIPQSVKMFVPIRTRRTRTRRWGNCCQQDVHFCTTGTLHSQNCDVFVNKTVCRSPDMSFVWCVWNFAGMALFIQYAFASCAQGPRPAWEWSKCEIVGGSTKGKHPENVSILPSK